MPYLKFELKKLWKQKAFFVVFICAILTSLIAIQTVSVPFYVNSTFEEYNTISFHDNKKTEEMFVSLNTKSHFGELNDQNEQEMHTIFIESRDLIQNYYDEKTNIFQSTQSKPSDNFIPNLIQLNRNYYELYTTYQLETSTIELENLEAQHNELQYMLKHNITFEDLNFMKPTTSMILRYSMEILFGIIPVLVLVLLAAPFLSREIETGSIVSLKTQPSQRKSIIFSKLVSLLLLTVFYIFSAIFSVLILSKVSGHEFGFINYPLRLFGLSSQIIPLWKYIVISFFYFLLFMSVIYLLSMTVGLLIKKSILTTIFIGVIAILGITVTTRLEFLKSVLNPFSLFNFRVFILGNRTQISTFNEPSTTIGTGLGLLPILIVLFSLLLFSSLFLIGKEVTESDKRKEKARQINLFKFEFLKINEAVPITHAVSISVLIVAILTLQLFIQDKVNEKRILSKHFEQVSRFNKIEEQENQMESDSSDPTLITMRDYHQKVLDDYTSNEINSFYKVNKDELNLYFQMSQRRGVIDPPRWHLNPQYENDNPTYFTYVASRQFVVEQKVRQINTNLPGYLQFTVYDNFVSDTAKSLSMDQHYPIVMSGLNNIHQFNEVFRFEFVIIALALLFYGSGYVLDKENGNQIVMMLTQPLQRWKFSKSKLVTSILAALSFSGFLILLVYLAGFILGGHGQSQYPILYYSKIIPDPSLIQNYEGFFGFMDLQDLIIRTIPLILMTVIFVITFSQLFSLFFKNRIVLFVIVGGLCFLGYQLSISGIFGGFAAWLPTTYLKSSSIVDGSIKILTGAEFINEMIGYAVLGFYSIINIALYLEISQRKEMGGL